MADLRVCGVDLYGTRRELGAFLSDLAHGLGLQQMADGFRDACAGLTGASALSSSSSKAPLSALSAAFIIAAMYTAVNSLSMLL